VLWRCLNRLQRPWLLVVDNADDPTALGGYGRAVADGVGWLRPPTHRRGTVVVTSRDGRVEQWVPWVHLRHVPTLEPDSGADTLMDLAPDAGARGDARALAVALGGLPLAMELAGSLPGVRGDRPASGKRPARGQQCWVEIRARPATPPRLADDLGGCSLGGNSGWSDVAPTGARSVLSVPAVSWQGMPRFDPDKQGDDR
jgi:hypothetical protein